MITRLRARDTVLCDASRPSRQSEAGSEQAFGTIPMIAESQANDVQAHLLLELEKMLEGVTASSRSARSTSGQTARV